LHNAPEILHRCAFFEDEADRKVERARTAHGKVVDCSVDGEFSDVTARKKNRAHHVGIGAERNPLAADGKDGAVMQWLEQFVAELRQNQFLHQLMAQLSATPMGKHDLGVICDRDRAGGGKKRRLVHDSTVMRKFE